MAKKKTKHGCLGCFGMVLIVIVAAMIIASMEDPTPRQQPTTQAKATKPGRTDGIDAEAIKAKVQASFTAKAVGVRFDSWKFGRLKGGIGILADNAAYWLDADGNLHAANGFARQFSPEIPIVPLGTGPDGKRRLTIDDIRKAVEK